MTRVLIVDDERDIRLVARMGLVRHGWDVEEADSGGAALARSDIDTFDAIILDQRMPELTGIETATELLGRGYAGPVVLFSSYLTPEVERSARDLGLQTLDKARVRELRTTIAELVGAA